MIDAESRIRGTRSAGEDADFGPGSPLDVLLAPFVSAGDVHPFLALGCALSNRGHRVTLAADEHFCGLARGHGLAFERLSARCGYEEIAEADNQAGHGEFLSQGLQCTVFPLMRGLYRLIERHPRRENLVVVAAGLMLGAGIAHEKLGTAWVTVHLQPMCFRSVRQGPRIPRRFPPDWLPAVLKRGFYRLVQAGADWAMMPTVNAFRRELGLASARRLIFDGWNSPDLVLGLFPSWFARPQPDWPGQTLLTGFPMYDPAGPAGIGEKVIDFLVQGEPPIVFTPGSLVARYRTFFEESLVACRRLGRRGMFLTRFPGQVPLPLPPEVRHFDYVPLARLLPHCAAMVHHGGIGTMSQAMAAGVPQLLVPITCDQPDNAGRAQRLGVAAVLSARQYRGATVARRLDELLTSPTIQARCREVAGRCSEPADFLEACRAIERIAVRDWQDHGIHLAPRGVREITEREEYGRTSRGAR
jgi:rhamnosyltransferase subunit B